MPNNQDPILHPRTKAALQHYIDKPAHGLLLSGKKGVGKLYVAQWAAKFFGYPVITIVPPEDKRGITIEQIRELYNTTRASGGLTVVIDESHTMSIEAQNAFLKLLEEPPRHTRFILLSHSKNALLETIRSRAQHIEVLPPKKGDLTQLVAEESTANALIHTTESLPGRLVLLRDQENLQAHQNQVNEAKQFYAAEQYSRHRICLEHSYDKEWARELLRLLAVIVQSLLRHAKTKQAKEKLALQALLIEQTAQNLFVHPGNPKIHLAKLAQQL